MSGNFLMEYDKVPHVSCFSCCIDANQEVGVILEQRTKKRRKSKGAESKWDIGG